MVINDLMDLIKKLFDNSYENIVIVDSRDREKYEADKMTIKQLKSYDVNKIDMITVLDGRIHIFY